MFFIKGILHLSGWRLGVLTVSGWRPVEGSESSERSVPSALEYTFRLKTLSLYSQVSVLFQKLYTFF